MTEAEIEARIRTTPPFCLRPFRVSYTDLPRKPDENFKAAWRLSCKCGGNVGCILGYPLKDLRQEHKGDIFVGPLAFDCAACNEASELLDTAIHGYHAEVGKLEGGTGSTHLRGMGTRTAFLCPHCGSAVFSVAVGFVFWDFDIIYDEPELPGENFFNEFLMCCTCSTCGRVSEPTGFGKL